MLPTKIIFVQWCIEIKAADPFKLLTLKKVVIHFVHLELRKPNILFGCIKQNMQMIFITTGHR